MIKTLLLGGATFLVWPLLLLTRVPGAPPSADFLHSSLIILGAVIALTVYQPHFLSTYYLNYSRGRRYILAHRFKLVVFPAALLALLSLFAGFVYLEHSAMAKSVLGWSLLIAFIGAAWHFALQAVAAMRELSGKAAAPSQRLLAMQKVSLVALGLWGVLRYLDIHGGSITLFGLRSPSLFIPPFAFSIAATVAITVNAVTAAMMLREGQALRSYIPWAAYAVWYQSEVFLAQGFYLVPVLHSLQYVPFFLSRIKTHSGWLWKTAALILSSIVIVQLAPPRIDGWLETSSSFRFELIFVTFLIFVNLHHFMMESITWRRSREDAQRTS